MAHEPIHTLHDLHRALARALNSGSEDLLDHCQRTVNDWLIPQHERDALNELIEAAGEALVGY